MNKIKTTILVAILFLTTIAIGTTQATLITQSNNRPYDGKLKVYIAEPQSRWDNYERDPYHYGFLDFAIDETLSVEYLETYTTRVTWNAQDAGYTNVKEDNIIAIAAIFNPNTNKGYAYSPTRNPFDAHYVDAAAGATPGNTGHNQVTEDFTHTVFVEEATASWCPHCPAMADTLNSVFLSGDYPFYFVALVANKNSVAEERLIQDYNLYGYPSSFFDGGDKVLVGGYDQESYYTTKIEQCGRRDVHDLNLSISVEWIEEGILEIEVSVTSNEIMGNSAPLRPTINGPTNGKINRENEYTFYTTDPDGDDIYYCVDWGDDSEEVCLGPYSSGEEVKATHSWTKEQTYTVRVKARDTNDLESSWAELEVSMPKSKMINIYQFELLNKILELLSNKLFLK